jgi:elongation factor 2
LNDLEKDFAQCEIIRSDPVVTYKETIIEKSSITCLAKSQNKHNRIFASSEPLHDELIQAIEKGDIGPNDDVKLRAKRLCDEFEWEKDDSTRIWCFGPDNNGPNVVVDISKGVQYLNEIKDSLVSGFQWTCRLGVLTEENVRGLRVNIIDCELHTDAIHRGGGQILPTARRLFYACELVAQPTLVEPIFLCEITAPMEAMGGVYQCLNQRRGQVLEEEQISGTPLNLVKAYLPVSESFGFTGALRGSTQGKAFPQCVFDHWELIKEMPLDPGSKAEALVNEIRKRKGLKEGIPTLDNFLDKM